MSNEPYRSRHTGEQIDTLLDSIPTKESLGLDRVDNTPDAEKEVKYATAAGSAESDASGNLFDEHYATKEDVENREVYTFSNGIQLRVNEAEPGEVIEFYNPETDESRILFIVDEAHIHATIADTADYARLDEEGNWITLHYATKEEVGQIQPKINALNNSVYELNEVVNQVGTEVDTLAEEVGWVTEKVNSLEGEVESVKEEVVSPKEAYKFTNRFQIAVEPNYGGSVGYSGIVVQGLDGDGNVVLESPLAQCLWGKGVMITMVDEAGFAESAFKDSEGNTIHEHYATKEEVGQIQPNKYANSLKATVSGEIIRVDDVSPIEHTVKVKVSGENLSTPTDVTVTRCGKNLFDVNTVSYVNNIGVNQDNMQYGTIESNLRGTHYIPCRPNTTYTFSKSVGANLRISCSPEAPAIYGAITSTVTITNNIATITTGENDRFLSFFLIGAAEEGVISYDQVLPTCQLEVGSVATEFEDYNGETYTPNADGTVDIVSVSPTMTLLTDTAGAIIDAEYNQDTNKAMGDVKEDIRAFDNDMATIKNTVGDFETALDELHNYAQALIGGAE